MHTSELKVVPDNWVSVKSIWVAIQWLIGYLWLLCCSPSIFRSLCVKTLKKKKKKKKKASMLNILYFIYLLFQFLVSFPFRKRIDYSFVQYFSTLSYPTLYFYTTPQNHYDAAPLFPLCLRKVIWDKKGKKEKKKKKS